MKNSEIIQRINDSIEVKKNIINNSEFIKGIQDSALLIINAYKEGKKTIFCGNGGSAADAQHLAAELSGKFYIDRDPIPAEACHVNSSFITAVSNDYSFDEVYTRYIKAVGKPGDVLVAISTSGNSTNIINAIHQAKLLNMKIIVLTGESGGKAALLADVLLNVKSTDTPRIQEAHILIGHLICEIVENELFGN